MEIVVNELSLSGQFSDLEDFAEKIKESIKVLRPLQKIEGYSLLKKYDFYDSKVTQEHNFAEAIRGKKNDAITRFKRILSNLLQDPYWEDDQRHDPEIPYRCEFTAEISGYSLAEACERFGTSFSFPGNGCEINPIIVFKDDLEYEIANIYCCDDAFWNLIEPDVAKLEFCKMKYDGTNLSFDELEDRYGFDTLDDDHVSVFLGSFDTFSSMTWDEISASDGLRFKPYKPHKKKDWFKGTEHADKGICKFRVSQKFRCFGYRDNDIFKVLRFEIDHKQSDNG